MAYRYASETRDCNRGMMGDLPDIEKNRLPRASDEPYRIWVYFMGIPYGVEYASFRWFSAGSSDAETGR